MIKRLNKSYFHTCWQMAFQGEKASRKLKLRWRFQQKRFKLYERYLSIYGKKK